MVPLPFRLKVPGADRSTDEAIAWTTFRLHGLVSFDGSSLELEWSGTGALDSVAGIEVRTKTIPLPTEALSLSLAQIRSVRLLGGWWRPRLELTVNALGAVASVPGSEGARVLLWFARRDRPIARALVEAVLAAPRTARVQQPAIDLLPATTPPEGSG